MRTNLTIAYDVTPAELAAARAILVPAGEMLAGTARRIEIGGAKAVFGFIATAIGACRSRRAPARIESYEFTDDGVTLHTAGQWQHWTWESLHSFAETDTLFVLRAAPQEGFVLPKRLFVRHEELDGFRRLTTARLSKPVNASQELESSLK
jgi:hypothetical protein